MPSSRGEWAWFLVGCLVIGGLIALIALAWRNYSGSEDGPTAAPAPAAELSEAPRAASAPKPRAPAADAPGLGTRAQTNPPARTTPDVANVKLTAARGDCWLEVRAGSATGPVLFTGILPAGDALRFREPALWIRAGRPAVLDVMVNGEPARDFPQTTAAVLVTPEGVETLSLG